ncbi:MAG TPA: hypothetical protein VF167_04375 [Longimicrobiaceae bacterium]
MRFSARPSVRSDSPRAAPSHPALVELVGPPGVGKSAVARALRQSGDEGDEVLSTTRPRHAIGWGGLLRCAVTGAVRFAPQFVRRPTRPGYRLSVLVQLLAHAELVRGWRGRGGIAVLDQGPVYLLSILQRALRHDGRNSRLYLRYWNGTLQFWADALRMIVLLEATDDVLLTRMHERGTPHSYLAHGSEEARRALSADRRSREDILNALKERNPELRVLRFDSGADPPGVLAGRILEELAQVGSPTTGGSAHDPSGAGSRR